MKGLFRLLIAAVALSCVTACKPTEQGYKSAYDAALRKRQAADAENMIPATGLQTDDGPQLRIIAGDSVYVDRQRVRTPEGTVAPYTWYVAVGVYKMSTNALANADALRRKGYARAAALRATDNRWYAVADGAGSLDSVRIKAAGFHHDNPGYPYVGLPASPVLLNAY